MPSLPQTYSGSCMGHSVGQTSDAEFAIFCVRSFWDMQKEMGTSKTCLPQLEERILHALAYRRPSEPHVGRATLQHDSRQFRVLWQCFLLVRTFKNLWLVLLYVRCLVCRTYNTLTTCHQLHQTRRIIYVTIWCTHRSILWGTITIHGTRLPNRTYICTWAYMRQCNSSRAHSTRLHSQHASIQICSTIRSANEIFVIGTLVSAIWSLWTFTSLPIFLF